MKVYVLHFRDKKGESKGYSFHRTKHDAMIVKHQNEIPIPESEGSEVTLSVWKVDVTRAGVLHALNVHASHANNG